MPSTYPMAPGLIRRVAVLIALASLLAVLPAPQVAVAIESPSASTETYFWMTGDGEGTMDVEPGRLFLPETTEITLNGTASDVTVTVDLNPPSPPFFLRFVAPPGEILRPGRYENARSPEGRGPSSPGIAFGIAAACSQPGGDFEIRDIGTGPDGHVKRLWLSYRHRCGGGEGSFGEVHIGIPDEDPGLLVAPQLVQWHDRDLGVNGNAVAVHVLATGVSPVRVREVGLEGEYPGDFPLRYDTCSDQVILPGERCGVWVRFSPTAVGHRTASLVLADELGAIRRIALAGSGIGGRTRFVMVSEPGDGIGQGDQHHYTPGEALIGADGAGGRVDVRVRGIDGNWWTANFRAPEGTTLSPGRHPVDGRTDGSSFALDIGGSGRGCSRRVGEFTVTSIALDAEGRLRQFGASYEQRCDSSSGVLRGIVEFRVPQGEPAPAIPGRALPPAPRTPPPPAAATGPVGRPRETGRTRLYLEGDPDDSITQGKQVSYSPVNAEIWADVRNARYITLGAQGTDDGWWSLGFASARGDILVPGQHRAAIRLPFHWPAAGLTVYGNGRGCNQLTGEFIIHSIGLSPDGQLDWFGASFEQHCGGKLPALRGYIEWRVPETDPQPVIPGPSVTWVGGFDRTATTVQASRDPFADRSAKAVVLARADGYADALAETPFASRVGGPLLLAPGGPTSDPLGKDEGVFIAALSERGLADLR